MEPITISTAEFEKDFALYQDIAMSRPVAVTEGERERTVLISAEEYRRLRRQDRDVLSLDDFTDDDMAALEASRPDPAARAFDRELES